MDTFSHHTKIGFETMEMHNQTGTTISFSILNQANSEKQYNSLLEILNNYKGVKVETKSLENETINITIDFIESADFNDLSEDELKRIVGIRKKYYNYPKITDNETDKAELIGDEYKLEELTDENIDFLYKLNSFFKNDFYCLEVHYQMGKTIDYSIHFGDDFAIKYMALKEFVENYNGIEIKKLKAENESIYLTINFIEEENIIPKSIYYNNQITPMFPDDTDTIKQIYNAYYLKALSFNEEGRFLEAKNEMEKGIPIGQIKNDTAFNELYEKLSKK